MAQWMISRAVYSCIAALEVNILNCRREFVAGKLLGWMGSSLVF
jgi:hypothetical protein